MGTLNMAADKIEQPIDYFVQVLSDSSRNKREKAWAASFIAKMALANPSNQKAIAAAGGILPLVKLLTGGSSDEHGDDAKQNAAGALWHLSDNEKNKMEIAEAGGIVLLVELLTGGASNDAKENAAGALSALAENNPDNQKIIAQAEEALVELSNEGTVKAQEYAENLIAECLPDEEDSSEESLATDEEIFFRAPVP